jgi:hypothetical protein
MFKTSKRAFDYRSRNRREVGKPVLSLGMGSSDLIVGSEDLSLSCNEIPRPLHFILIVNEQDNLQV